MMRTLLLESVTRLPVPLLGVEVHIDDDGIPGFRPGHSQWMACVEALLVGLPVDDAIDAVSRACGPCSVSHQLGASAALERAAGIGVPPHIEDLRSLLAWGDLIRSHAHQVFLVNAPDALGFRDPWETGRKHGDLLARGLRLRRAGSRLVAAIGGRVVHPVNLRCGGFHRLPERREVEAAMADLEAARDDCLAGLEWLAGVSVPDMERPCPSRCLEAPAYPLGAIHSAPRFDDGGESARGVVTESPVGGTGEDAPLTGPLARFNARASALPDLPRQAAARVGLSGPCFNPFLGGLVRLVEVLEAIEACLETGRRIAWSAEAAIPAGRFGRCEGSATIEGPRGMIHHAYRVDAAGRIEAAVVVPPSAHIFACVEADLALLRPRLLEMPLHRGAWVASQLVRCHAPCTGCTRKEGGG